MQHSINYRHDKIDFNQKELRMKIMTKLKKLNQQEDSDLKCPMLWPYVK